MSSSRLPRVLGFLSVALLLSFLLVSSSTVYSVAGHIVISEVQVGGTVANDEFVELYNPTNTAVDLSGWRLRRTGASDGNLVASMSGIIPAHGFFLVAHPSYTGSVAADLAYSTSNVITGNTTVTLYQDAGTTLVDRVGIGSVTEFEGAVVASPSAGSSIERKASASSTVSTMTIGGAEELSGNGEDTDNNANDFLLRAVSQPQNRLSAFEPVTVIPTITPIPSVPVSPTPSLTVTPSPSPTITSTPTQTPTTTPTMTPTSTPSPSSTPTMTLTTTPTVTATQTPTSSPTIPPSVTSPPSLTMTATPTKTMTPTLPVQSPTLTPVVSLTPTMTPIVPTVTATTTPPISISPLAVRCSVTYHTVNTRWLTISLPRIHCTIDRS